MIIGRLICENCGKDCTYLYGFALMTRGTIRNQQTSKELNDVQKEFGKSEFVWCWSCTAKVFGVTPTAKIEPLPETTTDEKEISEIPKPKQKTKTGV